MTRGAAGRGEEGRVVGAEERGEEVGGQLQVYPSRCCPSWVLASCRREVEVRSRLDRSSERARSELSLS